MADTLTTPTPGTIDPNHQCAIENALSLALHFARRGDFNKAVSKAIRGATLLKNACAESKADLIGGAA